MGPNVQFKVEYDVGLGVNFKVDRGVFHSRSCFQAAPGAYNHAVDEQEHTVEQWKELIYNEVMENENKEKQNAAMQNHTGNPTASLENLYYFTSVFAIIGCWKCK